MPNLGKAEESTYGLLTSILPGVAPGLSPVHRLLFGYDPVKYDVGHGVLKILGIGIYLIESILAARINFRAIN
jgi:2,3-bisphosphoglycerate-independent phosphoglycerate mutase